MTGELSDLKKISSIAKKNDALLVVDDAHGFGVIKNPPEDFRKFFVKQCHICMENRPVFILTNDLNIVLAILCLFPIGTPRNLVSQIINLNINFDAGSGTWVFIHGPIVNEDARLIIIWIRKFTKKAPAHGV